MMPSDPTPKLPMWIFFVTDAALLGAAAVIAFRSAQPLSAQAMLGIAACVICGAIVALLPLVVHFEKRKNEVLDERQRALEALARTVASTAEQIGIAVGGLHQTAELAQKSLKHAEQLPHKLQDKIAGFQSQLENTNEVEKEELEKELLALRAAETERLEAVATKIADATSEFARLEMATQQHLTLANEAIAKLSFAAAATIGKAQVAAEQAFAQAQIEAARGLGESAGQAMRTFESAKVAALAELDRKVAEASASTAHAVADASAPAIKRPRKVRPVETSPGDPAWSGAPVAAVGPGSTSTTTASDLAATPASPQGTAAPHEPKPIPAEKIAEITPVVPPTAEPFSGNIADEPSAVQNSPSTSPTTIVPPSPVARRPAATNMKTAAKKPEPAPKSAAEWADEVGASADSELSPASDDASAPAEVASEQVLSSDGATRLLVTAYIGIGNRLFIRGVGPGLSWEKGLPLQFVSIGKWRWETHDASSAVRFKIYKNDELECTALGARTLLPGYQREVSATF